MIPEAVAVLNEKVSRFKDYPNYPILRELRSIDRLIVPDILYKLTHHFSEIENKFLVLINDIDLDPNLPDGQVFTQAVIVPDLRSKTVVFTGCFDGRGHTLNNLVINSCAKPTSGVGLFGHVGPRGRIKDLGLRNVMVIGGGNLGALAGYCQGSIANCLATGRVTGSSIVSGLVGYNWGTITDSYASVSVAGNSEGRHRLGSIVRMIRCRWARFEGQRFMELHDHSPYRGVGPLHPVDVAFADEVHHVEGPLLVVPRHAEPCG